MSIKTMLFQIKGPLLTCLDLIQKYAYLNMLFGVLIKEANFRIVVLELYLYLDLYGPSLPRFSPIF